jgi:O-antigen/teichoic acid export membrane protein
MLIVLAEPIFIIMFSEKWVNSIPLFRILCLGGMANCLISVNYNLFISSGKSKQMFKWNIFKQLVGITNILIGLNWGVEGMLYGMVVNFWLYFLIHASLSTQISGYTILQQIKDCLPMLLLAIVASGVTWFICTCWIDSKSLELLLGSIIFISIYVGLLTIFKIESALLIKSIITPYISRFKK